MCRPITTTLSCCNIYKTPMPPSNMHVMPPRNVNGACDLHVVCHCHRILMCSIEQRLALPQYLEKRSWQMHGSKLHSLKCNGTILATISSQASGIWDIWTMLCTSSPCYTYIYVQDVYNIYISIWSRPAANGGLAIYDHPSRSHMVYCLTGYFHAVCTTAYMPIQSIYNVLLPIQYL